MSKQFRISLYTANNEMVAQSAWYDKLLRSSMFMDRFVSTEPLTFETSHGNMVCIGKTLKESLMMVIEYRD